MSLYSVVILCYFCRSAAVFLLEPVVAKLSMYQDFFWVLSTTV